jgi:phage terminase small subunit
MELSKVEQLQQNYLDAINQGNDEKVSKAREEIESFLSANESSPSGTQQQTVEQVPAVAVEISAEAPPTEVTQEGNGGQPGEAQAEPAKTTEGAPSPTQTNTEWLESLAPEVRKQVESLLEDNKKLHHRIKADDGRVAAYQGRYHELQKKAVQLEERLKATAQPQGNPAANAKKAPAASLEDDPELKQIAETDEQLAKVLWNREQLLNEKIAKLENFLAETVSPIKAGYEQQQVHTELNRLTSIVPNAIEIFNYRSPEGVNVWEDWVNRQPRGVQTLALSDNADDVARAMELYGRDIERLYYTSEQPAAATTTKQPVDTARVQGVQAERERKLQAQPVGSASVRPPQNVEPTMEEIWRNPELRLKAQEKILEDERRKRREER